ncbi:MAG: hypothetical protein AAB360_03990 [Patescibacteria group bacterium]
MFEIPVRLSPEERCATALLREEWLRVKSRELVNDLGRGQRNPVNDRVHVFQQELRLALLAEYLPLVPERIVSQEVAEDLARWDKVVGDIATNALTWGGDLAVKAFGEGDAFAIGADSHRRCFPNLSMTMGIARGLVEAASLEAEMAGLCEPDDRMTEEDDFSLECPGGRGLKLVVARARSFMLWAEFGLFVVRFHLDPDYNAGHRIMQFVVQPGLRVGLVPEDDEELLADLQQKEMLGTGSNDLALAYLRRTMPGLAAALDSPRYQMA